MNAITAAIDVIDPGSTDVIMIDSDPAGEILRSRGLDDLRAAVVHFCMGPEPSFVGLREAGGRMTGVVGFWSLPTLGTDLLSAISGVDDNARRLLARFTADYPAIAAKVESFDAGLALRTPALGWLLGAASLVLDLEERDLAQALRGGTPSLRLDTVVVREANRYVVDSRRLLRSVMSYRLAGVPGHVLARSVFDSLGEFAADAVRRLLRDWPAQVVVCTGDLFTANALLRGATTRGLVGIRIPVILPDAP